MAVQHYRYQLIGFNSKTDQTIEKRYIERNEIAQLFRMRGRDGYVRQVDWKLLKQNPLPPITLFQFDQ